MLIPQLLEEEPRASKPCPQPWRLLGELDGACTPGIHLGLCFQLAEGLGPGALFLHKPCASAADVGPTHSWLVDKDGCMGAPPRWPASLKPWVASSPLSTS